MRNDNKFTVTEPVVWWGYCKRPTVQTTPKNVRHYAELATAVRQMTGWPWGRIHHAANYSCTASLQYLLDRGSVSNQMYEGMRTLHFILTDVVAPEVPKSVEDYVEEVVTGLREQVATLQAENDELMEMATSPLNRAKAKLLELGL